MERFLVGLLILLFVSDIANSLITLSHMAYGKLSGGVTKYGGKQEVGHWLDIILIAPIIEELIFRGWLGGSIYAQGIGILAVIGLGLFVGDEVETALFAVIAAIVGGISTFRQDAFFSGVHATSFEIALAVIAGLIFAGLHLPHHKGGDPAYAMAQHFAFALVAICAMQEFGLVMAIAFHALHNSIAFLFLNARKAFSGSSVEKVRLGLVGLEGALLMVLLK
jgi:membrane protease YdiL (CAAX protease family)